MFWADWREIEKHNDWGVRDKDDATAAKWNDDADGWERRSAHELEFAQKQVDALERITKEKTVIDVCCGSGPLTLPLIAKAKHVTAFDYNENMLAYVKLKAAAKGATNIDYLRGNVNTIVPGKDFEPADIAVTRHSPAQGNILRFSKFAKEYCYSLMLTYTPHKEHPVHKRGRWIRSSNEEINRTPRPDGRKYGFNIHFNLLYEAGANPELHYVTETTMITAHTPEDLAKKVFPMAFSPEFVEHIRQVSTQNEDGEWVYKRIQTMSVLGWNPNDIQWDLLEKLGVDWE